MASDLAETLTNKLFFSELDNKSADQELKKNPQPRYNNSGYIYK